MTEPAPTLRIVSWNVNGIRAAARKGLARWRNTSGADLVLLQEVRALPGQLTRAQRTPPGWQAHWAPAERLGYSGVATFVRRELAARWAPEVSAGLGVPDIDAEGRLLFAKVGALTVVNGYFPNGNGPNRDHSRVPYKLRFYAALRERLQALVDAGAPALVLGDFNTAHTELDLARPSQNRGTSGFLEVERAAFGEWLDAGWVDVFRERHRGEPGHYTWWAQRSGCRERNIGWRIDYVLATPAAMGFVRDAFIQREVMGSDHCPVGVDIDREALRGW